MFVSVTLNICLLIGLASVYCLAMPTDGTPIRLCGSRLMEEIEKACTWPGYANPCMHGQQKSEADFPPAKRDTAGRMRRASDQITDQCCSGRCTLQYLQSFCCNDKELEDFAHVTFLKKFLDFLRLSLMLF